MDNFRSTFSGNNSSFALIAMFNEVAINHTAPFLPVTLSNTENRWERRSQVSLNTFTQKSMKTQTVKTQLSNLLHANLNPSALVMDFMHFAYTSPQNTKSYVLLKCFTSGLFMACRLGLRTLRTPSATPIQRASTKLSHNIFRPSRTFWPICNHNEMLHSDYPTHNTTQQMHTLWYSSIDNSTTQIERN